jgi:DNA-binding Lrp family transcriptional regulator
LTGSARSGIGLRVSLSAPAVKRRVDRLEADGVIRGFASRIDPGRFGWTMHALVALYCDGRPRRRCARR